MFPDHAPLTTQIALRRASEAQNTRQRGLSFILSPPLSLEKGNSARFIFSSLSSLQPNGREKRMMPSRRTKRPHVCTLHLLRGKIYYSKVSSSRLFYLVLGFITDTGFIFSCSFSGWLGALSFSLSLLLSPLVIGFCKRKSTRLAAVLGGLVTALGLLFSSFADQFHQLFLSYGVLMGKPI